MVMGRHGTPSTFPVSPGDPRATSTGIPRGQGDRGPARGTGAGKGARVAGKGDRGRPGVQGLARGPAWYLVEKL